MIFKMFVFYQGAHNNSFPFSVFILQLSVEKKLNFLSNFLWKQYSFTELRCLTSLCEAVSLWQPYLVLHCVSPHSCHVQAHSNTRMSLLTPAGPLESWPTQAVAGTSPDIPPSWRPESDAPMGEARLQSDARHKRSPAPLVYTIVYFQSRAFFTDGP